MSATRGTGVARTMAGSAAAASLFGTASRTMSAPASASARTCPSVASTSVVSVVVIDCTAMGAPPPIATDPTRSCRVRRRSLIALMPWWSYAPMLAPRKGKARRGRRRAVVLTRQAAAHSQELLLRDGRELLVDERLELLVGLRAGEHDAVHEERRRAGHADLLARLLVRLDELRLLAAVEALVELGLVELQVLRVALQRGRLERLLVREQRVVHLPVLPLLAGAVRRLRRLLGLRVERQRVVAV